MGATGSGAPRKRTLADGSEVTWCALCGLWADHYRAGHPITGEGNDAAGDGDGAYDAISLISFVL